MSETSPRIFCFNGYECTYDSCPQFIKQLDTCAFLVINIEGVKSERDVTVNPKLERGEKPIEPKTVKKQTSQGELMFTEPPFEVGKYINVQGVVMTNPEYKTGSRKDGTEWKRTFLTMKIGDEDIGVTLWDELALATRDMTPGMELSLKGVQVDEYKNVVGLKSAKYTEVL